jgi:hypothetical protein
MRREQAGGNATDERERSLPKHKSHKINLVYGGDGD